MQLAMLGSYGLLTGKRQLGMSFCWVMVRKSKAVTASTGGGFFSTGHCWLIMPELALRLIPWPAGALAGAAEALHRFKSAVLS